MLIPCPNCGPRDVEEFSYLGDATVKRPKESNLSQEAWNAYVYDRVNTAGRHREFWQHSGGCRAHLLVVRDTLTHAILDATMARAPASAKTTRRRRT